MTSDPFRKEPVKDRKQTMETELEGKRRAGIQVQNGRRRETEKAAAFLRESGANYLRGVYHRRPGWWTDDNVFLGARSIQARAEFERIGRDHQHQDCNLTEMRSFGCEIGQTGPRDIEGQGVQEAECEK